MVKIAILGHGVVGSGVVEVLTKNAESIRKRCGQEIEIKHILDIRDFSGLSYEDKFTKNFNDILNDPEVSVVAEVMGGITPAYEYAKASLCAGKSVVSSNKELIASKGAELLEIARENNVNLFFEASVGGGIPIIRPLHQCLAANDITEIAGILNGTTNFILTKMIHEGVAFNEVLTLAQELGYAERDPSADVDGDDACRKICILASLAFGKHIYPENIYTEGIRKITLADVEYAKEWGGVIKLIAYAAKSGNGVEMMTCPAFINSSSQLAGIEDVFNGILVRGDAIGEVVFYGKGAGKLPTASAVMGDIIDAVKLKGTSKSLHWKDSEINTVKDWKKYKTAFYMRFNNINNTTANNFIPENSKILTAQNSSNETAFITSVITETEAENLINEIEKTGAKLLNKIRVLDY